MLNTGRRLTCSLPWMREPLSRVEQAAYDFIRHFHEEHGRVPGVNLLSRHLSVSRTTGINILLYLAMKGWIGEVVPFSNIRSQGSHYLNDQPDECCEDCLGVVCENVGAPDGECREDD